MGLIAVILLVSQLHLTTVSAQTRNIFPPVNQTKSIEDSERRAEDQVLASSRRENFAKFGQLSQGNNQTQINDLGSENSPFFKTFNVIQEPSRKSEFAIFPELSVGPRSNVKQDEKDKTIPILQGNGLQTSTNVPWISPGNGSWFLDQTLFKEKPFSQENVNTMKNTNHSVTLNNSPVITEIPLQKIDVNAKSTSENQTNVTKSKKPKFYLIRNNNQTSSTKTLKTTSKITSRKLSKVLSRTSSVKTLVKTTTTVSKSNNKTSNNTEAEIPRFKPHGIAKFYLIREPSPKTKIHKKVQNSKITKPQSSISVSTEVFKTNVISKINSTNENVLIKKHESATISLNKPKIMKIINNKNDKFVTNNLLREPPTQTEINLLPQQKVQNFSENSYKIVTNLSSKEINNTTLQLNSTINATESTSPLESDQTNNELSQLIQSRANSSTKIDVSHETHVTNSTTAEVKNLSEIVNGTTAGNSSDSTYTTSIFKVGTSKRKVKKKKVRKVTRRVVKSMKTIQSKGSTDPDQTVEN